MPIVKKSDGWYWGSKGPFKTRKKAAQVAGAAYASGYKGGRRVTNPRTSRPKGRFR